MGRPSSRDRELTQEILALEKIAVKAETAGSFQAAVTARGRISTLQAELHRLRQEAKAAKETDPIERVRHLARQAAEDGSWIAASNLLEAERKLLAEREAEQRAKASQESQAVSDDQLLEQVETALSSLPAAVRAMLVSRLAEKPNPGSEKGE